MTATHNTRALAVFDLRVECYDRSPDTRESELGPLLSAFKRTDMAAASAPASWSTVAAFYAADPARERSPECDCGMSWRTPADARPWRVTVVEDLGEVIAVRFPDGPVELLASGVDVELVDAILDHLPARWSLDDARRALAGLADVDPATLQAFRADVVAYRIAAAEHEDAIERAGFVARRPAELPEPDVDVDAGMLTADWPAIGAAAAAVLYAGVDPLDSGAVADALTAQLPDEDARWWALSLFDDPITLDTANGYVNGRHRSACLQRTLSPVAVVSCSATAAAARAALPAPAHPIVPWL